MTADSTGREAEIQCKAFAGDDLVNVTLPDETRSILPGFHPQHHPSYAEFYDRILPQTRDPREIEEGFEIDLASRPEYIDRYRHQYAYHGVHPFYAWAWGCLALKGLSKILVVGARDPAVVEHLGFTPVPTLERVLSIAQEGLEKGYSLTHLAVPPIFVTEGL